MPVHAPPDPTLHDPRASLRMDARLDADTRQKVDNLARHFRQPRAAVLSHVMRWGLGREQGGVLDQGTSQGPVRHLYLYADSDLSEAVQKAATTVGVHTAPWLRYMVRHITMADFPTSWQAGPAEERFHESRRYGKRFMLRLDDPMWEKLETLSRHFETSGAEIIRQLLAQATPDTFPASWHLRVAERHGEQAWLGRRDPDDEGSAAVAFCLILRHSPVTWSIIRLLSESAHALARFCPEVRCLRASYLSEEPPLCLQGCRQTILGAALQDASSHR